MMKNALRCFLLCGLFNCLLSVTANGQSELVLLKGKPKVGERLNFSYVGPLFRTLLPEFRVYFYSGGPLKWVTVRAARDRGKLRGSFTLPAGTLAFCIKPDVYKDAKEAFTFGVVDDRGLVAGGYAGMAEFQYNLKRYTGLKDSLKAMELFREEFRLYPESKREYLLDYFKTGSYGVGDIGLEMRSVWADSLGSGKDEQFLYQLYSTIKDDKAVDGDTKIKLREEMLQRYPKGELALKENPNQARRSDLSGLKMLEAQYPELAALGKLESYYAFAARQEFDKGNYKEADQYLKKLRSADKTEGFCRYASSQLLRKGIELDWAAELCEQGASMFDAMPMADYASDEADWDRNQQYYKCIYYFNRLAEIRYKQGRLKEAIAAAARGEQVQSFDLEPKERYLKFLMEDGRYADVVKTASAYVLAKHSSEQIEALLRDAFLRQGAAAPAYQLYRTGLDKEKELVYQLPGEQLSGVRAIDFGLKDTNGKTVSLSNFRGKYVVLYFFVPYTDADPDFEQFMVSKLAALRAAGKVELLGIEETIVLTSDLARSTEIRRNNAEAFFKRAGVSFPLLLDTYIYNPDIYWSERYLDVSSDYGAMRHGTFFIIDKKGRVLYKSSRGAFSGVERLEPEFTAVLKKLIKN